MKRTLTPSAPARAGAHWKLVALGIVAFGGLFATACQSEQSEQSDQTGGGGDDAAGGPETDSGNSENPPPEDINPDTVCGHQEYLGPKASGTLTNHSSELSGYVISVGFLDQGGVRVTDATAFVNGVQANQTANWEAVAFNDVPYATCEIVSVERMAQ